ncbi:MAG: hypothetical protein FJ290_00325 [Planctomycetes bacterium]|nr:hypothetical protein [Planctomycetota bacterium]
MRVAALPHGLDGEQAAQRSYTLHTLLDTLGLRHEAADYGFHIPDSKSQTTQEPVVEIACGPAMTPDQAIALHRRISGTGLQPVAHGQACPERSRRDARATDSSLIRADGARVRIEADVLAAAALWLTGGDEASVPRDPFGRVPGAATPRAKAGLLPTPVVHPLMDLLWSALCRAAGTTLERVPAWPDGHKFAVCLTHDIDLWRKRTLRQFTKEMGKTLRRPNRLPAIARAFCRGPDPWSDLDAIAGLEERYGMRSTFFVLPGRPNLVVDGVGVVNSYAARPEAVRAALRRLVARGCEVALHASFDSYRSADALAAERRDVAALAGADIIGCRQHFLRLDLPATWRAQAQAGLRYDATLGYHDTDGHRPGLSFPFHPFADPTDSHAETAERAEENRRCESEIGNRQSAIGNRAGASPVLELPLTIYDGGLCEWGGLDAEAAWQRLRGYLERAEADGSMLGLLWHNTHFCDLDAPGYRGVYERALDWTRSHGGWGAPARDIADWWARRSVQLTTRRT